MPKWSTELRVQLFSLEDVRCLSPDERSCWLSCSSLVSASSWVGVSFRLCVSRRYRTWSWMNWTSSWSGTPLMSWWCICRGAPEEQSLWHQQMRRVLTYYQMQITQMIWCTHFSGFRELSACSFFHRIISKIWNSDQVRTFRLKRSQISIWPATDWGVRDVDQNMIKGHSHWKLQACCSHVIFHVRLGPAAHPSALLSGEIHAAGGDASGCSAG